MKTIKKVLWSFLALLVVAYLGFIGYSVYEYWMEKDRPHLEGRITPIQVEKIDKDTVEVNREYDHLLCTDPVY